MTNEEFESANQSVSRFQANQDRRRRLFKNQEDFKTLDHSSLKQMDDKALAQWQSTFEQSEPQWRLADEEWKRRAGISTRRIAIAAIVVSLLSLLIALASYIFPHKP